MDSLIAISERKTASQKHPFKRFLYDHIDPQQRLIVLLGHRGAGKTTLLFQFLKETSNAVYLSLDHIYFEANRLLPTIGELYQRGYRNFFLDEVHRYPNWAREVKNMYDSYDDVRIMATGSSILELSKGQADLSRRAVVHHLPGLSFREYLMLTSNFRSEAITLGDLLGHHGEMAADISDRLDILAHFDKYLQQGYYPFFLEGLRTYPSKLAETSNLIIDLDIQAYEELNYATVRNLKKLLYIIGRSVPFKPNVSKLAEELSVSRNTLLMMLDLMHRAQLIALLRPDSEGNSFLRKPEKIYLQNPNLLWILSEGTPGIGNLRETFFLNQLSVGHRITSSAAADFLVDDSYTFEVGGPSKTARQIRGVPSSYLAIDGIIQGSGNRIPLWLFGLLY